MMNKKIANRLGMFDLVKGLGMVLIVVGHTFNLGYIANSSFAPVFFVLAAMIGGAMMPAFMMASGYGLRKMNTLKCIRQQTKMMLVPYGYTLLGTTALHLLTRYWLTRSVRATLRMTWQVVGGFLMALPSAKEVHGLLYYTCGPMWYMIAIYLGWIILNFLMEKVPEKHLPFAVLLTVTLGWGLGLLQFTYFCLPQAMIASGFLYAGYMLKKTKAFQSGWIPAHWYLYIIAAAVTILTSFLIGNLDNMAEGAWNLGVISILINVFLGTGIMYLLLLVNDMQFIGKHVFFSIGRNSLYVFAVHTAEMHGIPWYLIQEKLSNSPLLANLITLILRTVFITAVVSAILFFRAKAAERN